MTATLTPPSFTHLHVHSHFTLLGATPSPDELAQRARAEDMTHLALTDLNGLSGAVAFDKACRAAGVQPIIGMTVTLAALGELDGDSTAGAGGAAGPRPGRLSLPLPSGVADPGPP